MALHINQYNLVSPGPRYHKMVLERIRKDQGRIWMGNGFGCRRDAAQSGNKKSSKAAIYSASFAALHNGSNKYRCRYRLLRQPTNSVCQAGRLPGGWSHCHIPVNKPAAFPVQNGTTSSSVPCMLNIGGSPAWMKFVSRMAPEGWSSLDPTVESEVRAIQWAISFLTAMLVKGKSPSKHSGVPVIR